MLRCRLFEKKLSMFVDGELSAGEYRKIIKHTERCQKCKDTIEQYTGIYSEVKVLLQTRVKDVKPYKEPLSQLVEKPADPVQNKPVSTTLDKNGLPGIGIIDNGDITVSGSKLLMGITWIKLVNIAFIILGFLLILTKPIHGS